MTTTQTKKSNFRSWMKDHSYEVTVYSIFAAAAAGVVLLTVKATNDLVKEVKAQEAWIDEQTESGHQILMNEDGAMVAVDNIVSIY